MNRFFVVDASSTMKLLVEEAESQQARLFFGRLENPQPPLLYAPDLLYIECANAVWKYVAHHGYSAQQAQTALTALGHLALHAVQTQYLFQEAFRLSLRLRITCYDACYLALAERLRCPLITQDVDLIRQVRPHIHVSLHPLAEIVSRS